MKKLALIVFTLAICFELLSRKLLPSSPHLSTADIELGYRLVPGASGIYHGLPLTINSMGLRDVEHTYNKPPGIKRIVVMGDSFTIGLGVSDAVQTYPKVLEKKLRDQGFSVEVINMGTGGYNTEQELHFLWREGMKYAPDIVLIGFVLNDNESPLVSLESYRWLANHHLLGARVWLGRNVQALSYLKYLFLNGRRILHKWRFGPNYELKRS